MTASRNPQPTLPSWQHQVLLKPVLHEDGMPSCGGPSSTSSVCLTCLALCEHECALCTGMGIPLYALSKDVNVGLHSNRLLPSTMLLKSVFHGPMLFKFRYQPRHSAPAQSCVGRVLPSELAYCEVGIFSTLIVEPYYCSALLYCQSMGSCCSRHSSQNMCTQRSCTIFILFWII